MKLLKILIFALSILFSYFTASSQRYCATVFDTVEIKSNVNYATGHNFRNQIEKLKLDIFLPGNDSCLNRPAVLLLHGGYFMIGNKEDTSLVKLCIALSRRGYVTVSMDYRLDTSINPRAIATVAEDVRAAIRFLRKNSSIYGIDTNLIAIGGESAGAYAAMAATYGDKSGELFELQDFQKNYDNLEVSSNVKACIDISGALENPGIIDKFRDVPLIIFHGNIDALVPYSNACSIESRVKALYVYNKFYPIENFGHGLLKFTSLLDSLTSNFLYSVFFNQAYVAEYNETVLEQNRPNPVAAKTTIGYTVPYDSRVTLKLLDSFGAEIETIFDDEKQAGLYELEYNANHLSSGVYYYVLKFGASYIIKKMIVVK